MRLMLTLGQSRRQSTTKKPEEIGKQNNIKRKQLPHPRLTVAVRIMEA